MTTEEGEENVKAGLQLNIKNTKIMNIQKLQLQSSLQCMALKAGQRKLLKREKYIHLRCSLWIL